MIFPRVSVLLPTPNPSQEGNIAEECMLAAQVAKIQSLFAPGTFNDNLLAVRLKLV